MSLPKLNKLLLQGLTENKITDLTSSQEKIFTRISGGASFYLLGEEGIGKTTGVIIPVLQKLNYSQPDTPRVVAMLSTSEDAIKLYNQFVSLAKFMDLKIHLVTEEGKMDDQNIAIYEGADIIVGTPVRLTKLYFQCGINVNKVQFFIVENGNKLIDNRQLVELDRFTDSLPKFQSIVIENELTPRLKKVCSKFMPFAQEFTAIKEEETEE